MSFSCPHFDVESEQCRLLKTDCVPGRRGCVLGAKAVFAVPLEERIREREEENRRRRIEAILSRPPTTLGSGTEVNQANDVR